MPLSENEKKQMLELEGFAKHLLEEISHLNLNFSDTKDSQRKTTLKQDIFNRISYLKKNEQNYAKIAIKHPRFEKMLKGHADQFLQQISVNALHFLSFSEYKYSEELKNQILLLIKSKNSDSKDPVKKLKSSILIIPELVALELEYGLDKSMNFVWNRIKNLFSS